MPEETSKNPIENNWLLKTSQSSLAISFTFRPTIDDHPKIQQFLTRIMQKATSSVQRYAGNGEATMLLHRLQEIIKKLDFDTQRKGLMILVTVDHEKVIYVKDEITTKLLIGHHLSILQLVSSIKNEFSFYLVVHCLNKQTVYEFKNQFLRQISSRNYSTVDNVEESNHFAWSAIEKLYCIEAKPIFLLGKKGLETAPDLIEELKLPVYSLQLMSTLYTTMYLLKICSAIQKNEKNLLSDHQIFRISIAERENTLVGSFLKVLDALRQNRDGLLLLDGTFLSRFFDRLIVSEAEKFRQQFLLFVERFLHRGNRVEITKPELLKEFDGIVLLIFVAKNNSSCSYPVSLKHSDVLF